VAEPVVALVPKCVECDEIWLPWDAARWRAYIGGADAIDPGEVFFYCPECANREYGDD
jgi:hypothetical protein